MEHECKIGYGDEEIDSRTGPGWDVVCDTCGVVATVYTETDYRMGDAIADAHREIERNRQNAQEQAVLS